MTAPFALFFNLSFQEIRHMKRSTLGSVAIATALSLCLLGAAALPSTAFAQSTASQDMKDAGQSVKDAGKSVGSATEKTATSTGKKVKKVTHKTAKKVNKGTKKVEDKTEKAAG